MYCTGLKKTIEHSFTRIKTMISGSHEEAQDMLRHIGTGPKTANELASQLIIMKR